MIKIKQISLTLSLVSMVATVSVSAMEENPGQLPVTQAVISTCGQSVLNALSGVKNVAYYGVVMVAAEARYIPDVINGVFTHIAKPDKEQNEIKSGTSGLNQVLAAIQNGAYNGANYAHNAIKNLNVSVYQVLAAIQNGDYNGANYAHNAINNLFTHIASGDE